MDAYMHSFCAPHAYLMPTEVGRQGWILWNWSYRCLYAIMWILGTEAGHSARASVVTNEVSLQSLPVFLGSKLLFN